MEILNPAWKQQQKRRLGSILFGLLTVQVVSANAYDRNLLAEVIYALRDDASDAGRQTPEFTRLNEIGRQMLADVRAYTPVDPDWALGIARDKGGSVWLGEQISVDDAMRYNYAAGFRGSDLIRKTAIDGKESNYYPGAVGDVNWNAGGDRSIGTAQIYCSPNSGIGCDGAREWRQNFDPLTNARSAYALYVEARSIWGASERFRPWRNNQAGIDVRMDEVSSVYERLEAHYGDLN